MAAGRKVTIEFLGNNRDLDRAMDGSVRRAGRFGSALKKAGRIAGYGLAAGALIAGKALYEMTKAAAADEAAQVKLAQTLRRATGATDAQIASTEDWITRTGELLGVTDDELRPALSKLAVATGDIAKAQDLAALAMDVSAGTGKSLEQVTTALAKAQNGSVAGLARLGVATKDAAGETKSFEQIQGELASVHNGQAVIAADTLQGKMNRLKIIMSEAGEEIGAKLIPVITRMVEWFMAKGLPAIQNFGGWIQTNLIPIFGRIGDVLRSVLGGMDGDTNKSLTAIRETVMSFVSIVTTIWNRFGEDIIRYLRKSFENAKQYIGGVLQIIQGIFKVFESILKGDWAGVWEGIKLIAKGALNFIVGIVKQALNLLGLIVKIGWAAIKGLFSMAWDGIKILVSKGVDKVVELVKSLPDRIKGAFSNAGSLLKTIGGQIIDGLKAGIQAAAYKVLDAVKAIIDKIPKKIRDLMGISSPSKVTEHLGRMIGEGLAVGLEKGGKKAEEKLKKRLERLKSQLDAAKDLFSGLRDSVAGSFTSGMFDAENATDFVAGLTSTRGTLGALKEAFKTLVGWGLKPGFLAQLFQSGNAGLILDLAKNKASAVEAGDLFGGITFASNELGASVAGNSYGAEIKALQDKIDKLEKDKGNAPPAKIDITVQTGVGDKVEIAKEMVRVIRHLERATGRQFLVSAG